MSSSATMSSVSPGTIISVLAMFLYCVGFVRIEWKLHQQNSRIEVLETKRTSESHILRTQGKALQYDFYVRNQACQPQKKY